MTETTTSTTTGRADDVAGRRLGGRWIDDWRPEDPQFWESGGKRVAWRNLTFSVLSEHIGFSVWSLWSVLVLFMGPAYGFTAPEKFVLTATPALVGSILRVPYTFAVGRFGGRNWTIISALMLLVPTIYIAVVLEPGVSLGTLLVGAMLAGVGGANFASSMTNINAYFPSRLKGRALGINAGAGNLGVAVVQLVGLLVLAVSGVQHPKVMVAIYIPLIVVSALLSAVFMDNLTQNSNAKGAMREVMRHRQTWIVSLLYIGTFGSFIGFGFAFGQVLLVQFPEDFDVPVKAAALTFLGPLLGSFIRPVGGALADRFRGSVVSAVNFGAMALGALVVLVASRLHSLPVFVVGFVLLFVLSGLGNGSVYKMIPAIFNAKAQLATGTGGDVEAETRLAGRRAGALIGLAGAIGGLGGVLVNLAFRQSFLTLKNGDGAYVAFIVFYVVCVVVTWAAFLRPRPGRLAGV
ncbi:MFS transporter, NNP family, nitrate/nitrite transporter [Microlunatus sagamiharensis]|uniref:MFS transporter, NNP family, nitrate/nitrite transporter n=1 Tax=Microlunatus sagamiharensis TaxID=546874 RepID=A0A1H2M7X3_9ACTN|nr:nitrate/nitrite transporter [Microlunatus sagamiharensis]SDU89222.1 MFS transporter, NNP family, nitrate/nitrite transporter [Microlunatus sagamiharensis]